ncbi:MAG: hypothetical protein IJ446_07515 [Oscillospiraceae bacterium]|nr:hypothetical protein [Oscillospiraceae bacterium]
MIGISDALFRGSGVLITEFYDDCYSAEEFLSENINGLCFNSSAVYGGDSGRYRMKGKIYLRGDSSMVNRLALDGDTLDGKIVRRQLIRSGGRDHVISAIKKLYLGDKLHHIEIEVS